MMRLPSFKWIYLLFLLLSPFSLKPAWAEQPGAVYTVSVVPQLTPLETNRDWTPFLEQLSRETGLRFKLQIALSFQIFEAAVLAGGPDFAFMNPYHQVMAKASQGYLPLVRNTTPLTGVLVVRRDSPIKTVQDLDGKEIAFPAPNALGASLWMRAHLTEHEHIKFKPQYVNTHPNVYRHVLLGKTAAGGGVNNTLAMESSEVRGNLRILLETPGVASHPFSAHPRVPATVREAVTAAFLRMGANPTAKALLQRVQMPDPVSADYARDYQPLEKYHLERYVVNNPPL